MKQCKSIIPFSNAKIATKHSYLQVREICLVISDGMQREGGGGNREVL